MNPNTRKTVLLLILAVLAGAFAYDRFVAKRSQVRMMDDLAELSESGEDHSENKISTLFNSKGSIYSEGNDTKWVKYSVLRPTLFQTYDVYVKYMKSKSGFVMVDKRDVPPDSDEAITAPPSDSGIENVPAAPIGERDQTAPRRQPVSPKGADKGGEAKEDAPAAKNN